MKILNIITYVANGQQSEHRHYSGHKLTYPGAQRIVRRDAAPGAVVERVEAFTDER